MDLSVSGMSPELERLKLGEGVDPLLAVRPSLLYLVSFNIIKVAFLSFGPELLNQHEAKFGLSVAGAFFFCGKNKTIHRNGVIFGNET